MVVNTGHVAFNVKDMDRMLHFYCDVLGMKRKFMVFFQDISDFIQERNENNQVPQEEIQRQIQQFAGIRDVPWMVYLEIADRQFIELFRPLGETADAPAVEASYGYQKISLEVADIAAAYAELIGKGFTPDNVVHWTADFAQAFNLQDPEGNYLEFVQYTARSPQIARS
jgi:catechol 2,3-dioxygenase-like lactoylglutathione lyase family enzyme